MSNKKIKEVRLKVVIKKQQVREMIIRKNIKNADICKSLGIAWPTLSNVLSGRFPPSPRIRQGLIEYLEASFDDLFEIQ